MDHPKCRTCGERHRLGHCPKGFGAAREKLGRQLKPVAEVEARAKALPERKRRKAKAAKSRLPLDPVVKAIREIFAPKRGRPRIGEEKKTIAARKPWKKLKMSERTWWRRQAEKAK